MVARDLADADIEELSADRRFATAYNAALQASKMTLACSGYRVTGQGHHQTSFEALDLALGPQASSYANLFETCRRKRNMVDYDMSGITSRTEVDELIRETKDFVAMVEVWISKNHPAYGPTN